MEKQTDTPWISNFRTDGSKIRLQKGKQIYPYTQILGRMDLKIRLQKGKQIYPDTQILGRMDPK